MCVASEWLDRETATTVDIMSWLWLFLHVCRKMMRCFYISAVITVTWPQFPFPIHDLYWLTEAARKSHFKHLWSFGCIKQLLCLHLVLDFSFTKHFCLFLGYEKLQNYNLKLLSLLNLSFQGGRDSHWVRGWVHPRQFTSPSEGNTHMQEKQSCTHTHTPKGNL